MFSMCYMYLHHLQIYMLHVSPPSPNLYATCIDIYPPSPNLQSYDSVQTVAKVSKKTVWNVNESPDTGNTI